MGLFDKGGGQDAGNFYLMGDPNGGNAGDYTRAVTQGLTKRGMDETENLSYNQGVDSIKASNSPLSMLFGAGGQMEQTNQRVNDLSNRGFSLQPEDYEAYGQASGDIARMFGQNEQSLSQALSDRGLSSSGAAGQAFSGSLGNKNEQLAGLQTNIAQHRMQMNQQRLAQNQNFLSQLGGQAQQGINSANQTNRENAQQKYQTGADYQGRIQGQNNEAMSQRMASANPGNLAQFMGGLNAVTSVGGTLSNTFTGMGGDGSGGMGMSPSGSNSGGMSAGGSGPSSGSISKLGFLA